MSRLKNIPAVKGRLMIGLYDSKKAFLKKPHPASLIVPLTGTADVLAELKNVPPGIYAVCVIQDLNENGKLDKSIVGIPKEPLGFSVIEEIPKGRPRFEPCTFEVKDKQVELTVSLVTR